VVKENYLASMETEMLGISPVAVLIQASTTDKRRAVKKETPPTEARNAHRPKLDGDILFYFI